MKLKKLLLISSLLTIHFGLFAQFSGSGSGTSTDPYLISNGDELNQMRSFLNNTTVCFKIINDIDLATWINDNNTTQGWNPVGNSGSSRFMGTLDGDNFTISNFKINRPTTDYIGLFGYTDNANIKNLKFRTGTVKGNNYTAVLVGYNINSNITNISIDVNVTGLNYVGGLVGYYTIPNNNASSSITDNVSYGSLVGTSYVGGIIGYANIQTLSYWYSPTSTMNIANNISTGFINGKDNLGGIIGCANLISMRGSYYDKWYSSKSNLKIFKNYTNRIISGTNYIGGLLGSSITTAGSWECTSNLSVDENTANGYINGENNVGGLIGYCEVSSQNQSSASNNVINNYSLGIIKGFSNVGGLIGYANSTGSQNINHNYTYFNIIGSGSSIGGIVGVAKNSSITNNVSIGQQLSGIANTNRICGINEAGSTFSNNLAWTKTIILENSEIKVITDDDLNGISYGLSALKLKATYQGIGYDFTNIWNISNTESFPFFIWQTAPAEFTNKPYKPGSTTINGKSPTGASITLKVNDITYTAVASGNIWSIEVPALRAGDVLTATAQTTGLWPSYPVSETTQFNGDGTLANPYRIYTEADLKAISDFGVNYILMNDIALTTAWTPLSSASNPVRGSFNGNNHVISNLYLSADIASLFGKTSSTATIKKLHVKASATNAFTGQSYTAGIVAINKGIIDSCSFTGKLSNSTVSGYIGGITAVNYGKIYRTFSIGDKTSPTATSYIGGLVGYNYDTINQAYSTGNIAISGATSYAGGLIGYNEGVVSNTYASGKISATDATSYAGGLVAYNKKKVEISFSDVKLSSAYRASGVIGYNDGTSAYGKNCVALGKSISGNNSSNRVVGGFANSAPAPTVTDNYANKDMIITINGNIVSITDNYLHGTGKTLDQLRMQANYSALSFNFPSVWNIKETVTYPYLFSIQSTPPEITTPVYSGSTAVISGTCVDNGSIIKVWTNKNSTAKYATVTGNAWSVSPNILNAGDSVFVTATNGLKGESYIINSVVIAKSYIISASANPVAGGTITGANTYNEGATATLTATKNNGYSFVNWTENGTEVSTNPTYTFTVSSARTLVANFKLTYTITASSSPSAGGSVSGSGSFDSGATITVIATVNTGYSFVNWTENGTQVSTNATYSFTTNSNRTLVANFSLNTYSISVSALPVAGGTVIGGGTLNYGATASLTATPDAGYNFVNWSENGTQVSTSNTYNFTVTGDRTLIANFSPVPHSITLIADPAEGGTVSGAGTYGYNSSVTVSAIPSERYNFVNWTEVDPLPTCATMQATNLASSSATLNATANPNYFSTSVSFEYGTSTNYGQEITATPSPITGSSLTSISAVISGLIPGTTYHYRVKVTNIRGTVYGEDLQFGTLALPLPTNGLLARWKFENNLLDSGPNGYNLTGTATYSTGINGKALNASEVYTTNATLKSFINNNNTSSVSLWFKTNGLIATGGTLNIFSVDGPNAPPYTRYRINILKLKSSTMLNITRYNSSTMNNLGDINAYFGSAFTNLDNSNWHHVVVCYTGSNVQVYIDNISVAAFLPDGVTNPNWPAYVGSSMGTTNATAVTICGNQQNNYANFTGSVDDVSIYNRVLTTTEISTLYNGGAGLTKSANNINNSRENYQDNQSELYDGTVITTDPNYTFIIKADRVLKANFVLKTFAVSGSAVPLSGGSVSGGGTLNYGATASLTAIPNSGYKFLNWSEGVIVVSTNPTYTFVVDKDRALIANFISTVGIDDKSLQEIRIYPNPAQDILNIDFPSDKKTVVYIFDNSGQVLISTTERIIKISHLAKGTYLVKIKDRVFKLVKQ